MIYFVAEDNEHYSEENIQKLKEKYSLSEICIFPDMADVKSAISGGKKIGLIAPYTPSKLDARFDGTSFFEVIYLQNTYFPFTKDQIDLGIDQNQILSEKLGIKITTSKYSFKDYGGDTDILLSEAQLIELRFFLQLKTKGFFFVGIPGTGKTFFAKCFAGETNRKLVEFNFSKIKEFQNPMHKIETILNYFKTTPGRYVIWIDEIEKQFADETTTDMLGVFLTELNEFQSDVSNVFFIATANNISYFAQRFPELLRPGGRFDRLFFLLPSKDDDVEFIFDIYVKEKRLHFREEIIPSVFLAALFPDVFGKKNETTFVNKIINELKNELKKTEEIAQAIKFQFEPLISLYTYQDADGELKELSEEELKKYDPIIGRIYSNKHALIKSKVTVQHSLYRDLLDVIRSHPIFSNYSLVSITNELIKRYQFVFPISEAKDLIFKRYRDGVQLNDKNRFPYTPSEISNIVNVCYADYYLGNKKELPLFEILSKYIEQIPPIQISLPGVKQMESDATTFLQV